MTVILALTFPSNNMFCKHQRSPQDIKPKGMTCMIYIIVEEEPRQLWGHPLGFYESSEELVLHPGTYKKIISGIII